MADETNRPETETITALLYNPLFGQFSTAYIDRAGNAAIFDSVTDDPTSPPRVTVRDTIGVPMCYTSVDTVREHLAKLPSLPEFLKAFTIAKYDFEAPLGAIPNLCKKAKAAAK